MYIAYTCITPPSVLHETAIYFFFKDGDTRIHVCRSYGEKRPSSSPPLLPLHHVGNCTHDDIILQRKEKKKKSYLTPGMRIVPRRIFRVIIIVVVIVICTPVLVVKVCIYGTEGASVCPFV